MLSNLEGKRYCYVGLVCSHRRFVESTVFVDTNVLAQFATIFPTSDEMLLPYVIPSRALDLFAWDLAEDDVSMELLKNVSSTLKGVPIHYTMYKNWHTDIVMLDAERKKTHADTGRDLDVLYLQPGSVDNYKFDFYK